MNLQITKFFPSYSYEFSTWGDVSRLEKLKTKFSEFGAIVILESKSSFTVKVSSNSFAFAFHPFLKDLKINFNMTHENTIDIVVTRSGERTAIIWFFYFSVVLSLLICVQERNLRAFIFPVFAYLAVWINSKMAVHPAHGKIRRIVKDL